jgi:hypothetical protein
MQRKLRKIYELIDEIKDSKYLYITNKRFYISNEKYYTDSKCQNEINKQMIDDFNEAERIKNNAEKTISFIIHK